MSLVLHGPNIVVKSATIRSAIVSGAKSVDFHPAAGLKEISVFFNPKRWRSRSPPYRELERYESLAREKTNQSTTSSFLTGYMYLLFAKSPLFSYL